MRIALCWIVLAIACDRGAPHSEAPAAAPVPASAPGNMQAAASSSPGGSSAASPPSPVGCTLAPLPLRRPAARRLVALGDLHGDLGGARAALRAAGAIDARDHWIGGELVVVQTGDVLDRGDDDRGLLDLIARLESEAAAAGGAFIMLLGNHELMNAAGDFRYVTPAGMHAFDDVAANRLAALGPGGRYGKQLAGRAVIAIVGDTVFSHAGVLGSWAGRADDVNQSARCWLDGQIATPPAALTSDDSPVWTRAAGGPSPDCAAVQAALAALGAQRMVVGHTVQDHGITDACGKSLWRIDVGLAKPYGGPIQVLELAQGAQGTQPRVIAGARD